jgi:hypothetical protein
MVDVTKLLIVQIPKGHGDENHRQGSPVRLSGYTPAAAQYLHVFEKAFHDEKKGQADNGQVVPAGFKGRNGDNQCTGRGHQAAEDQRQGEGEVGGGKIEYRIAQHLVAGKEPHRKQAGHVGTDGHEAGMRA